METDHNSEEKQEPKSDAEKVINFIYHMLKRLEEEGADKRYYQISLEHSGNVVPFGARKHGHEQFVKDIAEAQTFQPSGLRIELFTGKAINVTVTDTWNIPLKGEVKIKEPETMKAEPIQGINPEHHYSQMLGMVSQNMTTVLSVKILEMTVQQKDNEIQRQAEKIEEQKERIEELETQLEERPKVAGLAGVNWGEVLALGAEKFFSRNPGILGGLLGPGTDQNTQAQTAPRSDTPKEPDSSGPEDQQLKKAKERITENIGSMPAEMIVKVWNVLVTINKEPSTLDKIVAFINSGCKITAGEVTGPLQDIQNALTPADLADLANILKTNPGIVQQAKAIFK